MTGYSEILDGLQSSLHTIISGDATVTSYTTNIVDGLPYSQMMRGKGFPYVQVPIGTFSESQFTSTKKRVLVDTTITVFDRIASNTRKITDAVRNAIETANSTTRTNGFYNPKFVSSSMTSSLLPDEKPLYEYRFTLRYEWRGAV